MTGHPDLLDLDAVRSGHGRPDDVIHVQGCAECRATLDDLEALAADLKQALPDASFRVPDEIDQRILWQARKQALAIRRGRRGWRQPRWAGAAAAAVVLVGLLSLFRPGAARHAGDLQLAARTAAAPGSDTLPDVDGDGRVDILDAFALARAVDQQRGGTDVNGDGVVDQRDVDLLAARAVSLGGA